MILVMNMQKFDFEPAGKYRLPFPISIETGKCIGYLPVYETREDAEKDYPNGIFLEVKLSEKGGNNEGI